MTSSDHRRREASSAADADDELELAGIVEAFEVARRTQAPPPTVDEWVARHPAFAAELEELLPGVLLMESVAGQTADQAEADASAVAALPERLGEYRILGMLGRGGMGVVYLARQESLGREVALKVLPTTLDLDRGFLDRFQREAQVAARLSHPHIVPVYGVGAAEGRHFFAMRFVDGFALDAVLRSVRRASDEAREPSSSPGGSRGSDSKSDSAAEVSEVVRALRQASSGVSNLPPLQVEGLARRFTARAAVTLVLQVADALEHAHAAGVLHRDIKPGNILLDADGDAWVTDFGLCRIEEAGSLTSDGAVVGTLRYMAPEQVEGAADERSDVYSLGLVLYELLTLEPAFQATRRAKLIHDVLHTAPARVRRLRPDVPRIVETIVHKATAKLPEERYASAAAFARDLRAYLADRPIEARPPSALYLARLFVSRHRLATAVAVVALLLIATLTTLYVRDLRASRFESERRAYVGELVGAEAALRDGAIERAKRHLESAPAALRSWEWAHLSARVDQGADARPFGLGSARSIAVSPDGRLAALTSPRIGGSPGRVSVVSVPDGAEVRSGFDLLHPTAAAWSEDGSMLASVTRDGICIVHRVDADGQVEHAQTFLLDDRQTSAAWAGPLLVCGGEGGQVWVWDSDRSLARTVTTLSGAVRAVGSAGREPQEGDRADDGEGEGALDGSRARWWAVTSFGTLALGGYEVERVEQLDLAGDELADAAMDGRGHSGVAVTLGGAVHAISFGSAVPRPLHSTGSRLVSVALDGDLVAAVGTDKRVHLVDVVARRAIRALSGSPHRLLDVAFVPGTALLVTTGADGVVRTWHRDVAGGGVRLDGHVAEVVSAAFSADGERLVTGGSDGQVLVWDVLRGTPIHRFAEPPATVGAVALMGDGDTVVAGTAAGDLFRWNLGAGHVATSNLAGATLADVAVDHDRGRLYLATSAGLRARSRDLDGVGGPWLEDAHVVSLALDAASGHLHGLTRTGEAFCIDPSAAPGSAGALLYRIPHGVVPMRTGLDVAPPVGAARGLAVYTTADFEAVVYRTRDGAVERVLSNRGTEGAFGEQLVGATFSPDGERILVSTQNGLLGVWSVATGEHLVDLRGHVTRATRVVRSDATGTICSVASDGTARIWNDLSTPQWIAALERSAGLSDAARRTREALRRPRLLHEVWSELQSTEGPISRSTQLLITRMYRGDPGDPLTAALYALTVSRNELRRSLPPLVTYASRSLPEEDPRQPELRRVRSRYERARLLADVTGFAPGVEPAELLPKPSVQRVLVASLAYFPWLPVGRVVTAVTPWIAAGRAVWTRFSR
ncbi:MAG: serine/threonine-protein kinase [Planctomycetota bacterium]